MLSLVVMPLSNLCSRSVAEKRLMGLLGRLQWINTVERLRGSRQTSGPHISSKKKNALITMEMHIKPEDIS